MFRWLIAGLSVAVCHDVHSGGCGKDGGTHRNTMCNMVPAVTKKRPYRVLESWKEKEKGRRFSVIDGAVAVAVSGAIVRDGRGIDVVV